MNDRADTMLCFSNSIFDGSAFGGDQYRADFEAGSAGSLDQETLYESGWGLAQPSKGSPWLNDSVPGSLDDYLAILGDEAAFVLPEPGDDHGGGASHGTHCAAEPDDPALTRLMLEIPLRHEAECGKAAEARIASLPGRYSFKATARATSDPAVLQARARNRISADKCRDKKRLAHARLEREHEALQTRNRELCGIVSQLTAETYALKSMLMEHWNCDCELIQIYLRATALSWTRGARTQNGAACSPS